jgi:hypothetical protein
MRRPLATIAAVPLCALIAGCGAGGQNTTTATAPRATPFSAHGLTVSLPAGWRPARRSLTPHLADPREELSVGTFPLRYRRTPCAHMPGSALADPGPDDAFLTLMERGVGRSAGFPPRPTDFAATESATGPSEAAACVPTAHFTDHWFTFSDGGRDFHVLVAFGPRASAQTQRAAWRILDGLRVDASVQPTWERSA